MDHFFIILEAEERGVPNGYVSSRRRNEFTFEKSDYDCVLQQELRDTGAISSEL